MTIAWVVGSGGLLGSALCRVLKHGGTELFGPTGGFSWTREGELVAQFEVAVRTFGDIAVDHKRWEIYWAAGVGTMRSSAANLDAETRTLATLLNLVKASSHLMTKDCALSFASSAGAIYAGSSDYVVCEETTPAPTTAYAFAKLAQEDLVRSFVHSNRNARALLARISTLYGPGQSLVKQQGLLTHIARQCLRNQPVHIYVPFDTVRDYITSDDAAMAMVAAIRSSTAPSNVQVKIIASEQPVTIAGIISTFRRMTRRGPKVITSASTMTDVYPRRLCFRSTVPPSSGKLLARTNLLVGIAQVMAAESASLMQSNWQT